MSKLFGRNTRTWQLRGTPILTHQLKETQNHNDQREHKKHGNEEHKTMMIMKKTISYITTRKNTKSIVIKKITRPWWLEGTQEYNNGEEHQEHCKQARGTQGHNNHKEHLMPTNFEKLTQGFGE
jgi:hypothetical protein